MLSQLGFTINENESGEVSATAAKNSKGKSVSTSLKTAFQNSINETTDQGKKVEKAKSTDYNYAKEQVLLNNLDKFENLDP